MLVFQTSGTLISSSGPLAVGPRTLMQPPTRTEQVLEVLRATCWDASLFPKHLLEVPIPWGTPQRHMARRFSGLGWKAAEMFLDRSIQRYYMIIIIIFFFRSGSIIIIIIIIIIIAAGALCWDQGHVGEPKLHVRVGSPLRVCLL